MSFGAPEWLWGLLLVPLLVALFVRAERLGHRRLQEFVSARLLPQLAGTVNRPRRIARFALQLLGFSLVLVSLAQPRWGYTFQDVKRKGLDLLVAVDTSRSMLSNDVQPNRLDRVKLAVQDLLNELQGDRVGLIAFAGRAFLQAPLPLITMPWLRQSMIWTRRQFPKEEPISPAPSLLPRRASVKVQREIERSSSLPTAKTARN